MKVITTSSMVVQGGWGSGLPVTPTTVVSLIRSPDSGPSLCFPQTVRIQTRKVRVATITSQGWVEQNSPWLLKTFLTPLVNILVLWQGSPQPLKHTTLDQTAWLAGEGMGLKLPPEMNYQMCWCEESGRDWESHVIINTPAAAAFKRWSECVMCEVWCGKLISHPSVRRSWKQEFITNFISFSIYFVFGFYIFWDSDGGEGQTLPHITEQNMSNLTNYLIQRRFIWIIRVSEYEFWMETIFDPKKQICFPYNFSYQL